MQDAKEEVRARLNIEDVIGEYVQLKRAGRNFKGLSPFTAEKTPSFVVSPDKQIWHDFSSGRGGDVFSFVMEAEGLEFREALEQLATKAGVDLSQYKSGAEAGLAKRKKRLLLANSLAARYYQQSLLKNQHALQYVVKQRRLPRDIIQSFQIGYAPETGSALIQFLAKKGLTNRFGGDLFRGRMMVPLMDASGQVIGFTARILKDDPKAPKYLNTPQTLLYDKSRHVFGLSQAKESIRQNDYAVIVEGNMDVIASHGAGVQPVVATAGTALTEWHLKALSRLTAQVRLAFDADKAGLAASERAIEVAQKVNVELTMVSLPADFKDPDELIQTDVQAWQAAIDQAEPVVDWILRQYKGRVDLKTAAGKRQFTTAGLSVVAKLDDPVERDHYIKQLAELTDSSTTAMTHKLDQITSRQTEPAAQPKKAVQVSSEPPDKSASYQDDLLAAAVADPATHELFSDYAADMFSGSPRQAVASYLIDHPGQSFQTVPDQLQTHETYVKIVLLRAEARYAAWSDQDRYFEVAELLRRVEKEHKEKQIANLSQELRQAEADGQDERASQLGLAINQLIKETNRG